MMISDSVNDKRFEAMKNKAKREIFVSLNTTF